MQWYKGMKSGAERDNNKPICGLQQECVFQSPCNIEQRVTLHRGTERGKTWQSVISKCHVVWWNRGCIITCHSIVINRVSLLFSKYYEGKSESVCNVFMKVNTKQKWTTHKGLNFYYIALYFQHIHLTFHKLLHTIRRNMFVPSDLVRLKNLLQTDGLLKQFESSKQKRIEKNIVKRV
jgi:hypothetical protein